MGLAHAVLIVVAASSTSAADESSWLNQADRPYAVTLRAEIGGLLPLFHTVRLGSDGTRFDYVDDGGQDVVFPYLRAQAEVAFGAHVVTFLYQPIDIVTRVRLRRDVVLDEERFTAGTPLDLRYGFSFWRGGYLYDLFDAHDTELGLGAALQLRNATLEFSSADGMQRRAVRDLGPVPLLVIRGRSGLGGGFYAAGEAAGIYAPVRYLNGGDSDVEGAILDAAVQVGLELERGLEAFVTLRYLGGGASGTSRDKDEVGDGYTSNWLHFMVLAVGGNVR